jgi:hypothetical protein
MTTRRILAALCALIVPCVFACGGDDSGDSSSSSSSSSFTCCLNGEFYECPSSDAVSKCTLADGPGECSRDSSKDDKCS